MKPVRKARFWVLTAGRLTTQTTAAIFPKQGRIHEKILPSGAPNCGEFRPSAIAHLGQGNGPQKILRSGTKGDRHAVEFYSGNGLGSIEPAKGSGNLESS